MIYAVLYHIFVIFIDRFWPFLAQFGLKLTKLAHQENLSYFSTAKTLHALHGSGLTNAFWSCISWNMHLTVALYLIFLEIFLPKRKVYVLMVFSSFLIDCGKVTEHKSAMRYFCSSFKFCTKTLNVYRRDQPEQGYMFGIGWKRSTVFTHPDRAKKIKLLNF